MLTGVNTYTGNTVVDAGALRAGTAGAFGASANFVVNGGTLDLNGFDRMVATLSGTGGTLGLGSATLTVEAASGSATYAGSITGSGGLTKLGASTQTLTGASTYTGDTTIGGGILRLDFSPVGGPASDIIGSGSTLSMSGGTLNVIGVAGENNTQTFDGLNITAGNNVIGATSGTGGSLTVNLGAITRTGGLMNFNLPTAGNVTTTTTTLGGWATVNGTDYAKVEAGNIVAFTDADYTDKDNAANWLDNEFITDVAGFFGTVSGSVQLGGLRYTVPVSTTVTVQPGETLGVDGTIIVAPSVLNTNQVITGGMLTGATGGVLGIQQNSTGNFTIASQIVDNGGSLGFTKAGTGLVTLTNANNSYTGATRVVQGTLAVGNIGNGGAASGIGASTADSSNLLLEGSTLRYTGASSSSDRGFTLAKSGAILGSSVEVTNAGTNLTFSGLVTSPDDANFTKSGAGTLTLANAGNDYTGVTTINGGTLSVNTLADGGLASGIGASTGASSNLVLNGGELEYTGATASSNRGFTVGANDGAIDVANATTTLTLTGAAVRDTTAAVGSDSLTKRGAGTLVLSGTNTYTGGTTISAGTLRAGSTQAFGSAALGVFPAAGMTLANTAGATLDLNGFNNTVSFLSGGGASGGNVTLGTATLTLSRGTGTYAGTISGSGGVTVLNANQTMVGCNNSYTGATSIVGSTLSVDCLANGGVASGIGASSSASTNLSFNGGTLNYTGGTVTSDRGFSLAGSSTISVSNGATTLEFSGPAVGSGALNKSGAGTLVLSGINTYTGGTAVSAGTLRAGSNAAFGPVGGLIMANVAGAVLDLAGLDNAVTNFSGGGANGGNITLGTGTLTIRDGNNQTYAGAISGSGGLIKNGGIGSVQTLSGCNSSYTGSTTINASVLAVNCLNNGGSNSSIGASSAAADIVVINGGTLRYVGTGSSSDHLFTLGTTGGTVDASGSGTLQLTSAGAIALAGTNTARTLTLTGTNTGNNSLAAQIANNGTGVTALTKTGTGTWILTNPNSTYTGITTISGGILGVDKLADGGSPSSLGASSSAASNLVIGNGSTLRYTGLGDTTNRLFTLSPGVTFIESSGTGPVVFTDTGLVTLQGINQARTIALGGTNTGTNTLAGSIGDAGTGVTTLAKNDSGTWVLTGNNIYTGNTNINAGTLFIGGGGTTGSVASNILNNFGALAFDRADMLTYGGLIVGTGTVSQVGAGTTILTGNNTYTGATTVSAGALWINGNQSAATGLTTVQAGTILGGIGTIGGNVTIVGGTLAPGNSPGTLTINGDLLLDSGSILDVEFGQSNVVGGPLNDLIDVGGDLVLDGTVNVTLSPGGSFDAGLYRVITYGGSFTDNGLDLGAMPPVSDVFVQTSIAGQVNLVNIAGLTLNFWDGAAGPKFDGAIAGGSGVWQNNAGNDNWTETTGAINAPYADGAFAIFSAAPGVVTIDNGLGAVAASGMQFASSGYLITGSPLTLTGPQSIIRVGDGTAAGASMSATIAAELTGASQIVKTDLGTLVLDGINTYTGGTAVNVGTLQISSDANLGAAAGGLRFDGGALRTTATFATARTVALDGAGTFLTDAGTTLTVSGLVSGAGSLTKDGAGTLVLTGDNGYAGGTTIAAGTLQVGAGGATGSIVGNVLNDGLFVVDRSGTFTLGGTISGTGAVETRGSGTTILTGDNSYTGGTTIAAGTLQIGNGGTGAFITGNVANSGTLIFDHSDLVTFADVISGAGAVVMQGTGTLTLTSINPYSGATTVTAGAVLVNGSIAASSIAVAGGATIGGRGTIGPATLAAGATIAPGAAPGVVGVLTTGALTLDPASVLAFDLAAPNVIDGTQNDRLTVNGPLALGGTLQVTDAGLFASTPGSYRLIDYTGALTGGPGDVTFGATPGYAPGDAFIQTAVPSQVNLIVTQPGLPVQFWDGPGAAGDGVISGGTETWNTTLGNWTNVNATINQAWLPGMAIFTGAAGTVSLGETVSARALQFLTDGYVVTGGAGNAFSMTLLGMPSGADSIVRVDPGVTATISANLTGAAGLNKLETGTLRLGGVNSYMGPTAVGAGTLIVNGSLSSAVTVASGATLAGSGSVGAEVLINGGATLTPGDGVGTLTVGTLTLLPGSVLDYELATAGVVGGGVNDLIAVTGALTLDGALNATALTGFGIGTYRLIGYTGSFINNGLDLGALPAGFVYGIQTSVPGQVNLIVNTPTSDPLQYWNGSTVAPNGVVNGGSGVWRAGPTNWTNAEGITASTWGEQTAVFAGAAGTVMVEGTVPFSGLRFVTSGYTITAGAGGVLTTSTQADVLVTAGTTTVIDVPITGSGGLVIHGGGALTLAGANSYRGGTTIGDGTLSIASDANLGDPSGRLTFDGGTLQTTADLTSSRAVVIEGRGGRIDTGSATVLLEGRVGGPGALTKAGEGLLVLTGDNTYAGGTAIQGGTLQLGNCGTSGAIIGDILNNSVLVFSRSDTATYVGSISGSGSVIKNCSGTQILRGTNSYSGGTLITAGTLVGDTQSLQGTIVDNTALVFDQDLDGTFQGVLFGSGTLTKSGSGTVLLTGDHGLSGQTTVQAGTLALEGTLPAAVAVSHGATFDATGAIGGPLTVEGTVSVRSPESGGFGLLGVGGPVTFRSDSHYGVTVDAAGGNSALITPDRASVDGAIVDVHPQPGEYGRVTHYAIMRADGGLAGRATATTTAPHLDPIVTQNTSTLFLTVLRTDLPLQPFSVTASGWGIGGALDHVKVGATGDLGAVVRELTALDDAALGRALDVTAGEIHASAVQLAAMDGESIMDTLRSELGMRLWISPRGEIARTVGPEAAALPWGARGRRVWVRLRTERASFDEDVSTDGQGGRVGAHGADARLNGFALGTDWMLSPQWLLGVGGSYADGHLNLQEIDERTTFSAPRGFVYVGYGRSRWAIDGGVSVARTAYERRRAFAFTAFGPTGAPLFGGVDREATSDPSGVATEFWTEARYQTGWGRWTVQPSGAFRVARYALGDWQETGADALSLRADAQAITSTQADGGVRLSRAVGRVRPYAGGLYRRELSSGHTETTLQIGDGPGGLFTVDGLRLAQNLFAGQAGFLILRDRISATVAYELRHAREQTRQTLQLAVGF